MSAETITDLSWVTFTDSNPEEHCTHTDPDCHEVAKWKATALCGHSWFFCQKHLNFAYICLANPTVICGICNTPPGDIEVEEIKRG